MKCSKCGKEIANDSNYCEYCGNKQSNINHKKTLQLAIIAIVGLCILLVIELMNCRGGHKQMAFEATDCLKEITDTINNTKQAEMESSALQEELSHKNEENNNTKDQNQKKVFVSHQDGVYSVIFKEVKDIKENDLRDLVQYAIKSGRRILVEGYQDCRTGSVAVNQRQSQKRAENTAKLLNKMGVDASQIEVVSKGCASDYNGWKGFCIVSVEEKVEDNIQDIDEVPKEEEAKVFDVVGQMPGFPAVQRAKFVI